jgi:glutamate synthase (NADPH/NADH) small chain
VTQIEIMPKPPEERDASTPWPLWPYMLRTSSSHKEGCERRWNLNSLRFIGSADSKRTTAREESPAGSAGENAARVAGVEVETVEWDFSPEGRPMKFHAVPGTKEVISADLVLLAMGFTGVPQDNPIIAQLGLKQTPRTALLPDPARNIFCVGDCASGASLVVRALASGKSLPL